VTLSLPLELQDLPHSSGIAPGHFMEFFLGHLMCGVPVVIGKNWSFKIFG